MTTNGSSPIQSGKPVKASFELEGGKKLADYKRFILRQDLFNHHHFEIEVPFETLEKGDENFFHESHKTLCGKSITFSFKPIDDKGTFDLEFKGIITEITLSNLDDLSNVFVIKGYSPTILLEDTTTRRSFLRKNIQQIFDSVLSAYPGNILKKKLNPRHTAVIPYTVQYDETNFEFLNRTAFSYGEWFYYTGTELSLGEPAGANEIDFEINGIQSFDMSISLMPARFSMDSYDYSRDQTYSGKSSGQPVEGLSQFGRFSLDESENLFGLEAQLRPDKPVYSQDELDELIKTRRSGIASNQIVFHGRGENPELTVGTVINVNGTRPQKGGRSNKESFGKYRITGIDHHLDGSGNYSNSFKAVPETVKFPPVNPHVRLPVGQLDLATVSDNNDPDKLGRIKVDFCWPGEARQSDWIRVGTFYAGGADRKGMQFIPEKQSQVIVGYESGNPAFPFVLTSLYPKKEGMRSLQGNNDEKVIYTKAGNIIELIDRQNEHKIRITNTNKDDTAIILEFKESGKISVQTKGKIELTADDSIDFTAKQNITLKAQKISIKADDELECEGRQKASLKGSQISIEADTTVEVKANASAKLSSANTEVSGDAMTTIKGGLVKIN